MRSKTILVVAMFNMFLPTVVRAITWDILDETYGNGPGQVSFNGSPVEQVKLLDMILKSMKTTQKLNTNFQY